MRYLILFITFVCLNSCSLAKAFETPEVQEKATNIIGQILSGNTGGAIGSGIDLALMLMGYKALRVGGKAIKLKINKPITETTP